MPKIMTITGEENTSPLTTKATAYVVDGTNAQKVKILDKSIKAKRSSDPYTSSAIEGKLSSIVGAWTYAEHEVEEGTVLAFRAARFTKGVPQRNTLSFLRVRAKAAYQRVSVPLSGRGQRRTAVIEGRFDVLSADAARELTEIPRLLEIEWENRNPNWGTTEELEPEIAPPPVFKMKDVSIDGEVRRIKAPMKRRKLTI